MFNARVMQEVTKTLNQSIKSINMQNREQTDLLSAIIKGLTQVGSFGGDTSRATREIQSALAKTIKLVEAQTAVLSGLKTGNLAAEGADNESEATIKDLEDAIRKITDENRKQSDEIEDLLSEIERAGKDGGDDKSTAKKIKTATAALEKAVKLIGEQSKLLDEAKKALAG